jgi:hypothetical protein
MATARKPAASAAVERLEGEAESLDGWVVEELNGTPIRIQPALDWPKNLYQIAVHGGNFDALAGVIHEDDRAHWLNAECTVREAAEFLGRAIAASGQEPGESRASRRSYRGTARR